MNILPPAIIEQIFLYVPTKQILKNMVYISKQTTKIIMTKHFWINKCRYINPKVLHVLRELNEKEMRYILWYTSLTSEEEQIYSILKKSSDNIILEDICFISANRKTLMLCVGWLIGTNSDKHPKDVRVIFDGNNYIELYIFLKIIAALKIPLIYTHIYSNKHNKYTSININKYDRIDDIKRLRRNLKIMSKKYIKVASFDTMNQSELIHQRLNDYGIILTGWHSFRRLWEFIAIVSDVFLF